MKEIFDSIKHKTIKGFTESDWNFISKCLNSFGLSMIQKDIICLSLMFEETIEQSFKKVV